MWCLLVTVRALVCKIDDRVSACSLGVLFGVLFEVLVTVRVLLCKIEGKVSACGLGALFGVLLEVLVTVQVHFCEIDGRVLAGMHAGDGAGAVDPAMMSHMCYPQIC